MSRTIKVSTSSNYFEIINTKNGEIVIWNSKVNCHLKRRAFEKEQISKMIEKLGYDVKDFFYKPTGQPMISNNYLSISHASNWFAIAISNLPVGIDIEIENKKIIIIKSNFMNSFELMNFNSLIEIHLIWGAKEAFFKLNEGQITDIKKEITTEEITDKTITISYNDQKKSFNHKKIGDKYIVWG